MASAGNYLKPKILVIEDCALTRKMIIKVLEKLNFDCLEACEGNEGIEIFSRENPDIVLTDILMPGKAGLVTIYEIRRLSPKTPIVAMTGDCSANGFLDLAEDVGARYQLQKPFTPEKLGALLQRVREVKKLESGAGNAEEDCVIFE